MFVAIGCGTNLGILRRNLVTAITILAHHNILRELKTSRLYKSAPLKLEGDAKPQGEYLNMALIGSTDLTPLGLLDALKMIERKLGRQDTGQRWQARVLDLDILLYAHRAIDSEQLTIPHSQMSKRDFVLKPLCDLIPSYRPFGTETVYSMLQDIAAHYVLGYGDNSSEIQVSI